MGRSKSSGSANCNAAPVHLEIDRDWQVENTKTKMTVDAKNIIIFMMFYPFIKVIAGV